MIHRDFTQPDDDAWFKKWRDEAGAETNLAIQEHVAAQVAGRAPNYAFKQRIWKNLKGHLLAVFDKKCAYCEALFRAVSPGDVEHYRPKQAVKEEPSHPGYYWLAYHPENLLPSCEICNRPKSTQFPLANPSSRVFNHGVDLSQESPLLLNPYVHRPEDHLTFEAEIGTVVVKNESPIGAQSIKTYSLDREDLQEMRRAAQRQAQLEVKVAILRDDDLTAYKIKSAECRADHQPFAAAVRAHLDDYREKLRNNL